MFYRILRNMLAVQHTRSWEPSSDMTATERPLMALRQASLPRDLEVDLSLQASVVLGRRNLWQVSDRHLWAW